MLLCTLFSRSGFLSLNSVLRYMFTGNIHLENFTTTKISDPRQKFLNRDKNPRPATKTLTRDLRQLDSLDTFNPIPK